MQSENIKKFDYPLRLLTFISNKTLNMSNAGKFMMIAGIIMLFICLSQFSSHGHSETGSIAQLYLFGSVPTFAFGVYLYFRGKQTTVQN